MREAPLPMCYENPQARLTREVQQIGAGESGVLSEVRTGANSAARLLSLEEFQARRKDMTVVDARPEVFYRLGHVPGALSLPRERFEAAYRALGARMTKGRPVVVYCASRSCEDAELVRSALLSLGYAQVEVFAGGWAG